MPDHRLLFSKTGRARFISHLDLMRTFQRAFLRAGIHIKHTEGFNPHAFVSIALPLSVGYASRCEILEFGLLGGAEMSEVPEKLNQVLPEGIEVLQCYEAVQPIKALTWLKYDITLGFDRPVAEEAARILTGLLSQDSLVVQKKSKKAKSGFTQVDLIPLIRSYELTASEEGEVSVRMVVRAQDPGLNPALLLECLPEELRPESSTFQRMEVYGKDGALYR